MLESSEALINPPLVSLHPPPLIALLRLTKEYMKMVAKSFEDVKQIIRRARRKALDTIKKASSGLSKYHAKKLEREIDDLTKKFVKSAEDMCRAKEKEVTSG